MEQLIKTELITEYIKNHNMGKNAFCKLCKISVGTLNKILSNSTNIRILALFKIARVLNMEICNFLNDTRKG